MKQAQLCIVSTNIGHANFTFWAKTPSPLPKWVVNRLITPSELKTKFSVARVNKQRFSDIKIRQESIYGQQKVPNIPSSKHASILRTSVCFADSKSTRKLVSMLHVLKFRKAKKRHDSICMLQFFQENQTYSLPNNIIKSSNDHFMTVH